MDQTPKYSTTYKHCSKLTITITTGRIAAVGEGGRGEEEKGRKERRKGGREEGREEERKGGRKK